MIYGTCYSIEKAWFLAASNKLEQLSQLGVVAVEPVISKLKNSTFIGVDSQAKAALIKIGAPAVVALITALKYQEFGVRYDVAEVLGNIGDTRAVVPLIAALHYKEDGYGWGAWDTIPVCGISVGQSIGWLINIASIINSLNDDGLAFYKIDYPYVTYSQAVLAVQVSAKFLYIVTGKGIRF